MTHDQVKGRLAAKHHEAYDAAVAQLMGGMRPAAANPGMPTQFKFSAMGRPGTYDPNERLKDMDQDAVSTRIVVVLNWTEELKRLFQQKRM